ncbi:hypothetical protein ACA910_018894 [Epithemia clementina (nom. ined.)]
MADWNKASLAPGSAAKLFRIYNDDHGDEQHDDDDEPPLRFTSRRSPVLCSSACVATSQPAASAIGYDILKFKGGNAADAAIAIAAALAVTEPCSTGLGGDMFSLWYDHDTKSVSCINGSGKSPQALTWNVVQQACGGTAKNNKKKNDGGIDAASFCDSALAVTVPGAAQGWYDLYQRHGSGRLSFAELLEPAAQLAEQGFPVAPITAFHWSSGFSQITRWLDKDNDTSTEHAPTTKIPLTTLQNLPPQAGDIVYNPDMARVLRDLGQYGPQQGFYQGATGKAMVEAVQKHGGVLTLEDLSQHTSDFPQPIAAQYRHMNMWQVPPNGQGVAGLIALKGVAHLEEKQAKQQGEEVEEGNVGVDAATTIQTGFQVGTADAYHAQIEMMRLGFADVRAHVADANHMKVSTEDWLLNHDRIAQRVDDCFDPTKAVVQGMPDASSCTVSFQVVDAHGNAISFVNSNFLGFGTGIVPNNCGFSLQNRGFGFNIDDRNHVNAIAPNKRPFHTIIPAMLTHADGTNDLFATLSNMGANMQPQGHLQLTMNLLAGNMDPQAAIDMPRFCIVDGTQEGKVYMEEGVEESVIQELHGRGHSLVPNVGGHARSIFGRAQIIQRNRASGVLWAGSDGRADGCAMGY